MNPRGKRSGLEQQYVVLCNTKLYRISEVGAAFVSF